MTGTDLVRPSRDGDQFHYLRAARLSLGLLEAHTDLVAVTIEGVTRADDAEAGLDVIDLALYYGGEALPQATRVHYRQFKHSTRRGEVAWTSSGVAPTLAGFAARYVELVDTFGRDVVHARVRFEFETTRPIADTVVAVFAQDAPTKESREARYLRKQTGLSPTTFRDFAALVRLIPGTADYLAQRTLLDRDVGSYLPDQDRDAPLKLKELVTRKALSESADNPTIRREDVLHALDVSLRDLFPAEPLIEVPSDLVDRDQTTSIARAIGSHPGFTIIQADGGEGKSVTTTQLAAQFAPSSATFVYDCFGNGAYRGASGYRHRARDGLVQIANEMAAQSLCDPLIPSTKADDTAYVRAFRDRVIQASLALAARQDEAMLVLVIDAADNAQMIANDLDDGDSFPRLLLRETFPQNTRIVFTGRPHRIALLEPPSTAQRITLRTFDLEETRAHLCLHYPGANADDAKEFHRLTSQNPRVQAYFLSASSSVSGMLSMLGHTPQSVDDTIARSLARTVDRLLDDAVGVERAQFDRLFAALATLRPFVPTDILARVADVPVAMARSAVLDLGQSVLLRDDAVQFRDEPTEDWFRRTYRPATAALHTFIAPLKALAASSEYVAAALPQLMLEAGEFDELVELALLGEGLPATGAIARRDIELQRLRFALKAAVRRARYRDAAHLALKTAQLAAADERQQNLLTRNTDLAARFLGAAQLSEHVSRRHVVGGSWTGSEHAYEAAMLSGNAALHGEARSHLRMAYDWLRHFFRNRDKNDEYPTTRVEDADVAELCLAELNLHGAVACARCLRRWRPRELSFRVGNLLISRLADAGRFTDIDALAIAARNDIGLLLASVVQLHRIGHAPPALAVRRLLRLLLHHRIELPTSTNWQDDDRRLEAISGVIVAARSLRVASKRQLQGLVRRYTPSSPPYSLHAQHAPRERLVAMRFYALRAALLRKPLSLKSMTPQRIREDERDQGTSSPSVRRFNEEVGALIPWHALAAEALLDGIGADTVPGRIEQAIAAMRGAGRFDHHDRSPIADEVALLWTEVILGQPAPALLWPEFERWLSGLSTRPFIPTMIRICRRAAIHGHAHEQAFALAREAFQQTAELTDPAETKVDLYVDVTRALLASSPDEAHAYFNEAIQVSSRIGEENLDRWSALLHLATPPLDASGADAEDTYRLARGAEFTYEFVVRDKHFDWSQTVVAMAKISPSSTLAIASRWADRHFGERSRVAEKAVSTLIESGQLDPRDAFAFLGFADYWSRIDLLRATLEAEPDAANKAIVVDVFSRYTALAPLSADDRPKVTAILAGHGLDRHDITYQEPIPQGRSRPDKGQTGRTPRPALPSDAVFDGLDLLTEAGIEEAKRRFSAEREGGSIDGFFGHLFSRISLPHVAAFLPVFFAVEVNSVYDLQRIHDLLPAAWATSMAARAALSQCMQTFFEKGAGAVSQDRWFSRPARDFVARYTTLNYGDLLRRAVTTQAASTLPEDAPDLYRLVGLLALLIPAADARQALRYGLTLLEADLPARISDGPWQPELATPGLVPALAGYLWAALGAPEAATRWQAAHAVGILCATKRDSMLDALQDLATTASSFAYTDQSLPFYERHALQWLLFALRRAAKARSQGVERFDTLLQAQASAGTEHALLRRLAAETLLELHTAGRVELTATRERELAAINESPHASVTHNRFGPRRSAPGARDGDRRFLFNYDFSRHVVDPLAQCFGMSTAEVEDVAATVIRDEWKLAFDGSWNQDPRVTRDFFRGDSLRRYDGAAERDTYSLYLAHHATLVTAGRLLASRPLHVDPRYDSEGFSAWLDRFDVTLPHRVWLADRRDTTPALPQDEQEVRADGHSHQTVVHEQLLAAIANGSEIVVHGDWTATRDRTTERMAITSAFVSATHADALIRALATADELHSIRLPSSDQDESVDAYGFALEPWVHELDCEERVDQVDPWAAGLDPRFGVPSDGFVERFGLGADNVKRVWCNRDGQRALEAFTWSDGRPSDDATTAMRGHRLVAAMDFLNRVTNSSERCLIVTVGLERRRVRRSYEADNDENTHDERLYGIYRLAPDGQLTGISRRLGARPKARRHAKRRRKS